MPRTRRALLASLGAAAVAGCLGSPDASGSPTATSTGTDTSTATPTPVPPESVDTDWAAPAHDAGLSNGTTAPGPANQPGLLWQVDAGPRLSAPVVADGEVYAGGADGRVRALDARTGDTAWTASVGETAGAPWVRDGTVYVPADDAVVALDGDGTERWRVETPGRDALVVAGHGAYWLQGGTPTVVAHDLDGAERWRTDLGEVWDLPLFVGPDQVFVSSGSRDSRFWRLDADSGAVTGERPRPGADFPAEQYHRSGTVYAVDAFFGNVDTAPVGEGGADWSQGVPPGGRAGYMSGGVDLTYYVSTADEATTVTALSATAGTERWQVTADAMPTGRVLAAGSVALLPTDDGLPALDPADGRERWSLPVATDRLAVADDLLYAAVGGSLRAYRAP
jgi:outer membrane protein assembly factor BamB